MNPQFKEIQAEVPIPHQDWNAAFDFLRRNRPLQVIAQETRSPWNHPWYTTATWSTERQMWELFVKPGFVNGNEVEVSVDGSIVNLTDDIGIPVPSYRMRKIGADGDPVRISATETGGGKVSYEGVPDFFQALGVGSPPDSNLILSEGFVQDLTVRAGQNRLLRAVEIKLSQERLGTTTQWLFNEGQSIARFDVLYTNLDFKKEATISIEKQLDIGPDVPSFTEQLRGNWTDNPVDELHVATVYFLSPVIEMGEGFNSDPDSSWTPYSQHHLFWNLNHATNLLPARANTRTSPFIVPLAGGLAQRSVDFLIGGINDQLDAVQEYLNNRTLKGRFWTT